VSLRKISPLRIAALLLFAFGAKGFMDRSADQEVDASRCDPLAQRCGAEETAADDVGSPIFAAADFCLNVGYLCAGLTDQNEIRLQRWKSHEGTIVVHVPLPQGLGATDARDLQRAAAQGLQVWNNRPYPILADLRGDRNPHFAVRWAPALSGSQIGVARSRWSTSRGLEVESIELMSGDPARPGSSAAPTQVRLTAAHEMGHALGLPHSDSPRDVMYPTNTATAMSARDYRTIEILYATPDGTIIRP
jgi:hypothetical protein